MWEDSTQVKTENAITFYCKKFGKRIFNKVSYSKVLHIRTTDIMIKVEALTNFMNTQRQSKAKAIMQRQSKL